MNTKIKKLTSLLLSAGLAVSVFGSLTVSANAVASSDVIISGVQEELETQPNETETITEPTTDEPTTAPDSASEISLNKKAVTLGAGEEYALKALVLPDNAQAALSWSSGNTKAAVVDSNGRIKAKAVGTAVITVKTDNGLSASCTVTVKKAPTKLSLNKTSITLGVGESYDLNSKLPSGEASYSVVYTSGNTSVASVKASGGLVTANRVGTAVITATAYNGVKVNCTVTVKNAPTKLSLNKTSITLGVGESYDLNSKLPSGEASYSVVYTSGNTSVASVKASGGLVTANRVGTAVITATAYNGVKVNCTVTVKNAPTKLSLNKTSIILGVGESYDLNSKLPSGEASYSVVYTSNNSSVASVKASGGLVTAKKAGTATITAKTYNGKSVSCQVQVLDGTREYFTYKTPKNTKINFSMVIPNGCLYSYAEDGLFFVDEYNYNNGYGGLLGGLYIAYEFYEDYVPDYRHLGRKNGYDVGYLYITEPICDHNSSTAVEKWKTASSNMELALSTFRFE
ncbi:MAG: Ig-like domain-containing protein [Acutalibacteraceae bacterium]